jgi:hypothetical protein
VAAALALLTIGLIGYQFTGNEAVPAPIEALAPLVIEPPSPDVLAALINLPAEVPVSEPLISDATLPVAHINKPIAVTRPIAVMKSKLVPVSTATALGKNAKKRAMVPLPHLNAKVLPLLAPVPFLLAAIPAHPLPMISNPFKANVQPVTTPRPSSLVPIVRPPASIGTQASTPLQSVPAASSASSPATAVASPQTYASPSPATSSGGAPSSASGSQPMVPPAAIPAAVAAAAATQKKSEEGASTKPSLIDAMFPRLYLLSQAIGP